MELVLSRVLHSRSETLEVPRTVLELLVPNDRVNKMMHLLLVGSFLVN